jgi:hypothetical protein
VLPSDRTRFTLTLPNDFVSGTNVSFPKSADSPMAKPSLTVK